MKVDVYIHGVPRGQRIWKSDTCDDQIITQFYGANADEQTKYLVEVRKSGNDSYCYYSMLKYKNVSAQDGRSGSYFGITIRMDMVCTKVQALFHILDLVYNSDVLGNIIKAEGERLKFLVADFKDVESHCKRIVDKIMSILGQSVEGSDFIAIAPSMLSDKGCSEVNLSEYSSEMALNHVYQGRSVAVSADYPSSQLAAYMKKNEDEIANLRIRNQQQVETIQSNEAKSKRDLECRFQSEIQENQRKYKSDIEALKAKYANVDAQIRQLEHQIKQEQKQKNEQKKEIDEKNKMISKLQQKINSGMHATSYETGFVPHHKTSIVKVITTRILPFVNLLIVVALLGFVLWQMSSDNTQAIKQISSDLSEIKEKMASDNNVISASDEKGNSSTNSFDDIQKHSEKTKEVSKTDKGKSSSKETEPKSHSKAANNNKTSKPK